VNFVMPSYVLAKIEPFGASAIIAAWPASVTSAAPALPNDPSGVPSGSLRRIRTLTVWGWEPTPAMKARILPSGCTARLSP